MGSVNRQYVAKLVSDRFATETKLYAAPPERGPDDWDGVALCAVLTKYGAVFKCRLAPAALLLTDIALAEVICNELAQSIHSWEATHLDPAE